MMLFGDIWYYKIVDISIVGKEWIKLNLISK